MNDPAPMFMQQVFIQMQLSHALDKPFGGHLIISIFATLSFTDLLLATSICFDNLDDFYLKLHHIAACYCPKLI